MKISTVPFGAATSLLWGLSLARGSNADIGCSLSEGKDRSILEKLYTRTGGTNWATTWNMQDSMCTWEGITCDGNDLVNGPVSDIVLNENRLAGAIPSEIWSLPNLRYFSAVDNDLYNAGFTGFINGCNQHQIQVIDVSQNILESVEGIENAPFSLRFLFLTDNKLKGTVPEELLALHNIRKLYLNDNELTGTIPSGIGNLSSLIELYMYGNQLTGTIPKEIGTLVNLETLTLAENQLYGTIPEEVNELVNIKTFSVHNNLDSSGSLSGGLPSFTKSPHISELRLEGNNLSGTIPTDLFLIANTAAEMTIDLDNNDLRGDIPSVLSRFSNLFLGITGNRIDNIPEELCFKQDWMKGLVNLYGCDAIACDNGHYNFKAGRQETSDDPCKVCDEDDGSKGDIGSYVCEPPPEYYEYSDEDSDDYDDTPDLISKELTALTTFYMNSDPLEWENSKGWESLYSDGDDDQYYNVYIADEQNYCVSDQFFGLTCENGRVTKIILPYNGLSGEIHPSLFELEKLKVLDLSYNRVWFAKVSDEEDDFSIQSHGFQGLRTATSLEELNMSGTATTKWDGIEGGSKLKHLYLNNLLMEGTLPDEIYSLTDLEYFEAKSSDIHGKLSSKLGMLTMLKSVNLYYNRLQGSLPSELGLLTDLTALELSENEWEGTIPTELQNLQNIEEIAIHDKLRQGKGLTGSLPKFDTSPKLMFLSLESNKLDGTIPEDFLGGYNVESNGSNRMFIGLSDNKLTGNIPDSLLKYKDVFIDLAGNEISMIYDFCENDINDINEKVLTWMDGEVKDRGCNAIMCPKKSYSSEGRSISDDTACEECASAKYYGSKECDEKPIHYFDIEKDTLIEFYTTTGGRYWENEEDKWNNLAINTCNFYGVTCDNDKRVKSIDLQNNGLSGDVPPSLFYLEKLTSLKLANNSVDIKFENIESESVLVELNLEGTQLQTMKYMSNVTKLPKLETLNIGNMNTLNYFDEVYKLGVLTNLKHLYVDNIEFNDRISSDISKLKNLLTFSCKNCDLYGNIPEEFGKFEDLEKLNLAKNNLDGLLLDFQENDKLSELDLSNNAFTGNVPPNFLKNIDRGAGANINLSNNTLTGPFPESLLNMDDLFIALEGNAIESLPTDCNLRVKWMDGLVKENGCDAILCHVNSFTDLGRAYKNDNGMIKKCIDCNTNQSNYLGSTSCTNSNDGEFTAFDENDALITLYKALNGTNWIKQRNWMSTSLSICKWQGVKCNKDEAVISIQLDYNNMIGNVPNEVFKLKSLTSLQISGNPNANLQLNNIRKELNLTVLEGLKELGLSSTLTSSLSGIDVFPGLQKLYAGSNKMNGIFPIDLISLTKLELLEITNNKFTGSLDGSELEKLNELEEFYASNNDFLGVIPSEFGSMTKLQQLDLAGNRLSGSIPTTLNMLTKMTRLSLQGQKSPGGIEGPLPSFSKLSLVTLELQNNLIQGDIPSNFLSESSKKNDYVKINVSFNELTGTIPDELIENFNKLDLDVTGNRMRNIPEASCTKLLQTDWMGIGDPNIGCKAIGCPIGTYNDLGRESKDDLCKKCTNNQYFGSTVCPESYADERGILKAIYLKTKGELWSSKDNWMDDEKSICDWEGVTCQGNLGTHKEGVTTLNLEGLGLDGFIPSVVFKLPYLKELNLKMNKIKISFGEISSAKLLETLNLSNTGLESIKGLSNAKSLRTLHLSENKLSGKLSETGLFDLPELETLFIPYNNISGSIPRDIGKMKKLIRFYAYDNMIEGSIPTEIGELQMLETLVLSENQISGQLPNELGSLLNLELFAAYRLLKPGPKLDGTLPAFDKSASLNTLYLDYNNIRGTIPSNFLEATNGPVDSSFSYNLLTGDIPASLAHIDDLAIELEGNMIKNMDGSFCNKNLWMSGLVTTYNCNAILCFPGFVNENGRATAETPVCEPCPQPENVQYFGGTSCDAVIDERDILKDLYMACGGNKWATQDGWMSGAHVCDWFGIKCDKDKNIISINLTNNKLEGKPNKEIFQLKYLEELCYHENNIEFSFDGIEQARALTILHLGKTGLSSMEGAGMAPSLQLIQLDDNNLSGSFPQELFELRGIKTIEISKNSLTGTLSQSFDDLEYLVKLDIGYNQLSGRVPSFENNWRLQSIDLSNNLFDLPIPANFLLGPPAQQPLFVDLSSNKIPGEVPTELDRFNNLNIDISDNKILFLPETMCDNDNFGWQDGRVEEFFCSAILCPAGTTNAKGKQDSKENPCVKCQYGSVFLGMTKCTSPNAPNDVDVLSVDSSVKEIEISFTATMAFTFYYLLF